MFGEKSATGEFRNTANQLMKLHALTRNSVLSAAKCKFHLAQSANTAQHAFVSKLLNWKWMLSSPAAKIHQVMVSNEQIHHEGGTLGSISFWKNPSPKLGDSAMEKNDQRPYFYVVRDDLLHPLVNGNKARKLDGLLPLLEDYLVTDVVTCGGCQSAHAAAVAVSCADRGLKSHLLLRGEQPETLTGHNLISMLYGNVTYVPRSVYASRDEMLTRHADLVAGSYGSVIHLGELFEASFMNHSFEEPNSLSMFACSAADRKKVVIIEEGARNTVALLGVIRLVQYLSQNHILGNEQKVKFVVDAGTGTTAVGLGLGALCLGLPWEVTAVMLADTLDAYKKQEECLISEFCRCCALPVVDQISIVGGIVHWVERRSPRKFGNILKGEVEVCQHIAQQTGILLEPLYTLAAWELASQLSQEVDGAKVVMLHTGGTLGMFGLAQRYKSYFQILQNCSA